MRSFWKISSLSWSKQHLHSFFLNPSSQVEHNHHLVLRGKTPPNVGIICERYWLLNLAPIFGHHIEVPPKTTKCQPNKKNLHSWSVRFLYLILAHMIAGTTLDQWKPPIHVDCHLVGHKPHHNVRW
jgi:hypothetical protein